MKKKSALRTETLGNYAYQAISKHYKKSIKHEADVLKDEDPEPLHQMRVGMRRLRTVLQVFDSALDLPKAASSKRIKKIARSLGAVRDLDVLGKDLEAHYRPRLKGTEQEKLDSVLENLQQQRRQDFTQLEKTLASSRYQKFERAFQAWLDQPAYNTVANLPILEVLPDLLLPLISQLLLHPGWLVGATVRADKITVPKKISSQALNQQIEEQGTLLHDLRKQMKRVRYQTEFFVDFYDPTYTAQVKDFKAVQELLGQIQDSQVLNDFLVSQIGEIDLVFPSLVKQIRQDRAKAWKTWRPIQQRYVDPEFRQSLRSQVMTPLVPA